MMRLKSVSSLPVKAVRYRDRTANEAEKKSDQRHTASAWQANSRSSASTSTATLCIIASIEKTMRNSFFLQIRIPWTPAITPDLTAPFRLPLSRGAARPCGFASRGVALRFRNQARATAVLTNRRSTALPAFQEQRPGLAGQRQQIHRWETEAGQVLPGSSSSIAWQSDTAAGSSRPPVPPASRPHVSRAAGWYKLQTTPLRNPRQRRMVHQCVSTLPFRHT